MSCTGGWGGYEAVISDACPPASWRERRVARNAGGQSSSLPRRAEGRSGWKGQTGTQQKVSAPPEPAAHPSPLVPATSHQSQVTSHCSSISRRMNVYKLQFCYLLWNECLCHVGGGGGYRAVASGQWPVTRSGARGDQLRLPGARSFPCRPLATDHWPLPVSSAQKNLPCALLSRILARPAPSLAEARPA